MANHTRTQGANARSQSWEDYEEQVRTQRTGSWLPLEALEDDQVYVQGPQLKAVPVAPPPGRTGWLVPRRPQHTRQESQVAQPARERNTAPRTQTATRTLGIPTRAVAMALGGILCALAAYVIISAAVEWTQIKIDDVQYGRPRTTQMDAYVGHNETEGVPTHFLALNLNRRVTIMELPGGDPAKAVTLVGPYLFGEGEDLTPVQSNVQDVNLDGHPDLVISLKSEQLIYLNDGNTFRLMTPEERAALQKATANALPQGALQGGANGEAGK